MYRRYDAVKGDVGQAQNNEGCRDHGLAVIDPGQDQGWGEPKNCQEYGGEVIRQPRFAHGRVQDIEDLEV